MPRYDFRIPRLFVDGPLIEGAGVPLDDAQANYLANVLRRKPGEAVLVFNGRDGEWHGTLARAGARRLALTVGTCARLQTAALDLHYQFAPLKHARVDYMAQKVVEMGASRLQPVLTRHTQITRVNLDRLRANAIEAAEQCGILTLPEIGPIITLERAIGERNAGRLLVFCDEDAPVRDPVAALTALRVANGGKPMPLAVLIGPEGGFDDAERAMLLALPNVVRLALGPRILRADTAAVAALALVGAVLGDWR